LRDHDHITGGRLCDWAPPDRHGRAAPACAPESPRRLPNDTQIYEEFFDLYKSIYFHVQGDFKSLKITP
jgi:hypothetical protein